MTDYNTRAAKGQAYNLAVHDAVSKGKTDDKVYVMQKYVEYFTLAEHLQNMTIEETKDMIKDLNQTERK